MGFGFWVARLTAVFLTVGLALGVRLASVGFPDFDGLALAVGVGVGLVLAEGLGEALAEGVAFGVGEADALLGLGVGLVLSSRDRVGEAPGERASEGVVAGTAGTEGAVVGISTPEEVR